MNEAERKKRAGESELTGELVERVGAGRFDASVFKTSGGEKTRAWFVLDGGGHAEENTTHGVDEVLSLVKLAQVLSATVVFEGCVEEELQTVMRRVSEELDLVLEHANWNKFEGGREESPQPASGKKDAALK